MQHKTSKPTNAAAQFDSLWAGIVASAKPDVQPPGSMTTAQFAKQSGMSRAGADAFLRRLVGDGKMVKKQMRLFEGKQLRETSVYTPLK